MISFEIEGMLKVVSEVDKLHDDDLGIQYGLLKKTFILFARWNQIQYLNL